MVERYETAWGYCAQPVRDAPMAIVLTSYTCHRRRDYAYWRQSWARTVADPNRYGQQT